MGIPGDKKGKPGWECEQGFEAPGKAWKGVSMWGEGVGLIFKQLSGASSVCVPVNGMFPSQATLPG